MGGNPPGTEGEKFPGIGESDQGKILWIWGKNSLGLREKIWDQGMGLGKNPLGLKNGIRKKKTLGSGEKSPWDLGEKSPGIGINSVI